MPQIGKRELELPLIQGGMGIGVSLGGLAGAVAACGAMGVVSAANPGFDEADFDTDPDAANLRALTEQIHRARETSKGRGLIGVNVMVATRQYAQNVRAAVAAGADAIISGAGLPIQLPELAGGSKAALAPIVSSGRAAHTICKLWDRHHAIAPDFVVVEGSEAGGHLGFSRDELLGHLAQPLEGIVADVRDAVAPFAQKHGHAIPVFAAGGVYDGDDAARLMEAGAAGVQVATRFIATPECDASPAYKEQMLAAREEDVVIIDSPVGMPGRALRTPLIQRLLAGEDLSPRRCYHCLRPCNPATAPYCITEALIAAVRGDVDNGLFFCGGNVHRLDRLMGVPQLIAQILPRREVAP